MPGAVKLRAQTSAAAQQRQHQRFNTMSEAMSARQRKCAINPLSVAGERNVEKATGLLRSVSDRLISHFGVCGFPPFRQKKGERMGHGVDAKSIG
jgi:hypothetical protein